MAPGDGFPARFEGFSGVARRGLPRFPGRGFPVGPVGISSGGFAANPEPNPLLQASAAPLVLSGFVGVLGLRVLFGLRGPRRLSLSVVRQPAALAAFSKRSVL